MGPIFPSFKFDSFEKIMFLIPRVTFAPPPTTPPPPPAVLLANLRLCWLALPSETYSAYPHQILECSVVRDWFVFTSDLTS
jgi:hypothetical protein